MSKRISSLRSLILLSCSLFAASAAATVSFTTFVSSGEINSVLGQTNTIGFTYAGNKFVGSVYFGANNLQLYQTNLTGGGIQTFGSPLPDGGGEVVLAASLGLAGFGMGNIYASGADNNIYMYGNSGGAPTYFASTPDGSTVRQIFFDPGSGFGGNMLVTTTSGLVISYTSSGSSHVIANLGQDSEGMDIASSNYGQFAGDLLVASEGSGEVHAVSPTGVVTLLQTNSGPVFVGEAETVSTVPLNLGTSGNPIEGFYVADYPYDIQYAGASQFAGLLGDTIVTDEYGSGSGVWALTYNGDATGTFDVTQVGTIPNQSEDGIFVTAQRIQDVGGGSTVPEPDTMALIGIALSALVLNRRLIRGAR